MKRAAAAQPLAMGARLVAPAPSWAQAASSLTAPTAHHHSFDPDHVIRAVDRATHQCALLIQNRFELRYEPQGLSYTVAGHELTLVLHTWPEHGVTSLDTMLLGNQARLRHLLSALERHTGWRVSERHELERRR